MAKQIEKFGSAALGNVIELGEFAAKRADRATVRHDLRLIHDEEIDEAENTLVRCLGFRFPPIEH